jgi:hypothetical protein
MKLVIGTIAGWEGASDRHEPRLGLGRGVATESHGRGLCNEHRCLSRAERFALATWRGHTSHGAADVGAGSSFILS